MARSIGIGGIDSITSVIKFSFSSVVVRVSTWETAMVSALDVASGIAGKIACNFVSS